LAVSPDELMDIFMDFEDGLQCVTHPQGVDRAA
jgi:hypothetical protein